MSAPGRRESRCESACTVVTEPVGDLGADRAYALFAAGRELLSNVQRHAGAREVLVELCCDGDRVELSVCDDGSACRRGARPATTWAPGTSGSPRTRCGSAASGVPSSSRPGTPVVS